MKKILALTLALAMMLCLFVGCGSKTEEAPAEEVSEAPVSEAPAELAASSEPAPEADAELIESVSDTTTADTNAEASELGGSIDVISYPLDNGTTLTLWRSFSAFIFGEILSGWEDMPTLPIIEEKTGVSIDFISPSEATESEQFNLMIASGEYPDLFNLSNYTGGIALAYEEEVCIDLTDIIDEYAPNYMAYVNGMDDYTQRLCRTEEGKILQVLTLTSEVLHEQGLALRTDWLEKWDMEVPSTIDEMHGYLTNVKTEYNCKYPMFIDNSGVLEGFTAAFGMPGFQLGGSNASMMLEGETVVSGLTHDGYRQYLETFHQWYSEGLIKEDFYSEKYGPDYINAYVSAGDCGLTTIRGDKFETMKNNATDPEFKFGGSPALTLEEGGTYKFMMKSSRLGNGGLSISTDCENPEDALMFMNWFYTDEGYILSNYGEEGVAFNYNAEGEPEYTEFITNNPNGWNMVSVRNIYTNPVFPMYNNATALLYTYADYELEAFEMWAIGTDECSLPTLNLTTDESSEYTLIVSDICSFVDEQSLKWMVGEEELTDEAWNEYVAQVESMNLGRAVEIYQTAYDRFMAA